MCQPLDVMLGEAFAPGSTASRVYKIFYYFVLAAIFFGSGYYFYTTGVFN